MEPADESRLADAYLVAHMREALLSDERLREQSVEIVVVSTGCITIRGEVATPQRRVTAVALLRELAPDLEIIDDLRVTSIAADPRPEEL